MKLKSLKFSAFGPYVKEQYIDFRLFENESLFLISGPTGAGKTTIFDAISFALYGDVSGQRKDPKTLKSQLIGAKKLCFVELTFEAKGKEYIIKRVPEQFISKLRGDGQKIQKHIASLKFPDGTVKTNIKEILDIITNEILGVDKENFNRLIMLPQGNVQKILTEKGEEQVKSFRKLFDTNIYELISIKLFEEKQNIKKEYNYRLDENLKKLDGFIISCEKENEFFSEKKEELSFSEKVDFIFKQNLEDEKKLKELEKQIEGINIILQKLEVEINMGYEFRKNMEEQDKLDILISDLTRKKIDSNEFKKKKLLLQILGELKIYYILWQEKINILNEKEFQLKNLKEEFNIKKEKNMLVLKKFEGLKILQDEKEKIYKKQQNFVVIKNKKELVDELIKKKEYIEKSLKNIKKDIDNINIKMELSRKITNIKKIEDQNLHLKELIKIKNEYFSLQKELKNIHSIYINLCAEFYEQQAFILAKKLKKGKACPVCGSFSHPAPKKIGNKKFISQAQIENLRKTIFEKKDKIVSLKVKIEDIIKIFKDEQIDSSIFSYIDRIEDFLKSNIKNVIEQKKEVDKNIKNNNLKYCLIEEEKKYIDELFKLNVDEQKNEENIKILSNQIDSFMKEIPKEFFNKSFFESYEKNLENKKIEITKKIERIEKEKEDSEKEIHSFIGQYKFIVSDLKEAKESMEKSNEVFSKKLEDAKLSMDEFIKYFSQIEFIKNEIDKQEDILKNIEKYSLQKQMLKKAITSLKDINIEEAVSKKQENLIIKKNLQEKERQILNRLAVNKNCLKDIDLNIKEIEKLEERFKVAGVLSEVAKGGRKRIGFEKYVLTSCLNEVLFFANDWLKKVTNNRYSFSSLDGVESLSFNIFDSYSAKIRPVSTLSGGETFAASLALCLGLCSRVCSLFGGVELGTMLIDEGFGSLDSGYLDSVISCLMRLNDSSRQIGLISHVSELKNRVKAQIRVKKSSLGSNISIIV